MYKLRSKIIVIMVMVFVFASAGNSLAGQNLPGGETNETCQTAQSSNPFWVETWNNKHRGKEAGRYLHADIAKVLGMPTEQFNAELRSGKKLTQIIEERGLTKDQFRQKMLETKKQSFTKFVTDRKLTQEQADINMQRMERKLDILLSE